MRLASSVADFLADPVGAQFRGRAFAVWMPSPSLVGGSHYGPFEAADLPALSSLFEIIVHPKLVVPYDVIHDLGGVGVLDRPAFEMLSQFLAQWMPKLVGRVRKLAVIRPAGLAGAAFTGLFHDHGMKFEAQIFASCDEAFEFLGTAPDVRGALAEVAAAFEAVPVLRRLRDLLATDPSNYTLERAAGELGQSPRSLQRHLSDASTSFRDELTAVRIAVAKQRLVETDDKIEVIANDLGFRSVPAFTTMFGRLIGESPQAFRDRRRA